METLIGIAIAIAVNYGFAPAILAAVAVSWVVLGFWRRRERAADRRALEATKRAAERYADAYDAEQQRRNPGYADTLMRLHPWRTAEQHARLLAQGRTTP